MKTGKTLPDPDSYPDRDVVIYDGKCQLCGKAVSSLQSLDKCSAWLRGRQVLSYISLHDPRVGERYPTLSHEMMMDQMYIIPAEGRQYGGADAVRYLTRRLPILWWAVPLMHFPGTARLWRWGYAQVARQRYRWNQDQCDGGACAVHFGDKKSG